MSNHFETAFFAHSRKINLPGKKSFFLFLVVCAIGFSPLFGQSDYNLKLGEWRFNLRGTASFEYNDNINGSSVNPLSDFIISPGIRLDSEYPLTEYNTFRLNLGMDYKKYLHNPQLDSNNNFVTINPDSQFSFQVRVENLTLVFYDQLSYSVDGTNAFLVTPGGAVQSNVADYGRFNNEGGVRAEWNLNDVILSARAGRGDVLPTQSEFNYTQRHDYFINGGPTFRVAPNLQVGLDAGYAVNRYRVNFNNNSSSWSVGPVVSWQYSPVLSFNAGLFYQAFTFSNNGTNGDNSQTQSWDGSLVASHRLSNTYSHSLAYRRSLNYGFISNTTTVDSLRYDFTWNLFRRLGFNGFAGWSHSQDSGGISPEKAHQYTGGVAFSYQLGPKITSSLTYRIVSRDSNIPARTYVGNSVILQLNYDF